MNAVFEYESYRDYLKDFYQFKKRENPSFSFRFFAKRAGLNSGNYLKLVMDGERNLTQKSVLKFIKGLALNEWESLYFENLVFLNQCSNEAEKKFYSRNMELAKSHHSQVLLTKDQYDVLSNWHPLAIKELTLLPEFNLDMKWIANRLNNKITPAQAKEALELLERLDLIKIDFKTNTVHNTHHTMHTAEVDTSGAVGDYHKKALALGSQAISEQSVDQRCLNSLIIAVNKKDLPDAFKKISKFTKEMNSSFMKGKPYDAVYQLSIQLFRMDADE